MMVVIGNPGEEGKNLEERVDYSQGPTVYPPRRRSLLRGQETHFCLFFGDVVDFPRRRETLACDANQVSDGFVVVVPDARIDVGGGDARRWTKSTEAVTT